jgi:hypothetical protein
MIIRIWNENVLRFGWYKNWISKYYLVEFCASKCFSLIVESYIWENTKLNMYKSKLYTLVIKIIEHKIF